MWYNKRAFAGAGVAHPGGQAEEKDEKKFLKLLDKRDWMWYNNQVALRGSLGR